MSCKLSGITWKAGQYSERRQIQSNFLQHVQSSKQGIGMSYNTVWILWSIHFQRKKSPQKVYKITLT